MRTIAGVISIWAAAILAACGGGPDAERPAAEYDGPVGTAEALPVMRYAPAAAVLEARRHTILSSRTMAQVLEVRVQAGERVSRGQLLVRLDDRDLRAAERQAEAALFEARAVQEDAARHLRRMENLRAQKAVAQATYDAAKTGYERAVAAVRTAEAALAQVRASLAYTRFTAPFDGVVSARLVEPGDFAGPGQPLLRVEDQTGHEATALASRSSARAVSSGDTVFVVAPPSDARVPAVVVAVAPAQTRGSTTVDVRVRLLQDPGVPTGTFVRVLLPQRESEGIVVPPSALTRRGQLTGLYLVDGAGRPALRWIETGEAVDAGVLVLSGLRPGDRFALDAEVAKRALSQSEL